MIQNQQLTRKQQFRNAHQKKKHSLLKAFATLLCMMLFTQMAQAQSEILKMTNGSRQVPDAGFLFYDSGGPLLYDPAVDPENADEYNWTTWYQHNEEYTLTLVNSDGGGIEIEFEKIRVNNDVLSFYEGDAVDANKLIGTFCNNDYSTDFCSSDNKIKIVSHGNMTVRFVSDNRWRDEGWVAEVKKTTSFEPQPPVAAMAACDNIMTIIPTCWDENGISIEYQIGSGAFQTYAEGSWIALSDQTTTVTVRCNVNGVNSAKNTFTFNEIKDPDKPDYTHNVSSNTVTVFFPDKPAGVNDTYYIRWTINNNDNDPETEDPRVWDPSGHEFEQPANTPNTVPAGVIDYTNISLSTPFYIHFATRGTTCSDHFSQVETVEVTELYVPKPTITFVTSGNQGSTTIACSLSGSTIYYTTDGSEPDPAHVGGTNPTQQYTGTSFNVPAGTTVKAIAVKTNYTNSPMASEIFIPGAESGNGQNGVYGNIVLLDDREGHDWSYYSDDSQPIHKLNPADVKITYFGYGENTMTTTSTADEPLASAFDGTVLASQVAVGPSDPGNQFIYLKTLENSEDDGSGTYPYTLIPNPFSVRPAFEGTAATTRTIVIVTSRNGTNSGWDRNPPATLTVACNGTTLATINSRTTTTINNVPVGGEVTLTFNGVTGNNASTYNGRCRIAVYYDAANTSPTIFDEYNPTSTGMGTRSFTVATPAAQKDYRGFYAWRVKRLSDDLYIQRANGTTVGEGAIIPAEEEIQFIATNAKGNEVEFEALWAKAYVVTSNTTTGLNANVSYERNFVVGATPSALNMPITYSSYYPDGEFRANSSVNDFTCQNNTKFEYMTISGGTFTANNHDLVMGRGLTGTATLLQGISGNAAALNYTLRVESGTYTQLAFVRAQTGTTVSGLYLIKAIMGCDYDRANNEDNSKLSVSPSNQLFFSTGVTYSGSGNKDQKTFDCVFKSGSYQSSYWGANVNNNGDYQHSAYLGQNSAGNTYPGMRFVTVEGGEFGSICGGRGVGGESTTYASPEVVTFDLRIKGGLLHGCVYGAAADNPSIGSRRIVITGGEIRSWVAAGCNGTGSTSGTGATNGDSYVYVGGDAVIGGNNASVINGTAGGQVFGAGRGLEGRAGSINTSNVVIADNANISNPGTTGVVGGNVYGGGFNSYIVNVSNVYIVGGTIQRSVFGGSYGNGTAIPTSNVFVKGGTVNESVYGGSNNTGTINNSHVTMTGGQTKNVFGGGYGSSTIIGQSTTVNVSGGTLVSNLVAGSSTDYENGNVYGGGDAGRVTGNTNVTVSGGTINNVFGAGKGATGVTALISGQTRVNVSGGSINNVYGGGEAGNVEVSSGVASTVTIQGGSIHEDVFGGGRLGKTTGNVIVNVFDGSITGNVYGGAFGRRGEVFIAGNHTVNITGGNIYTNVYGGSRNADDALTFDHTGYLMSEPVNRVNISGGHVYYQVFAGGYFGHAYGSVYAFIGQGAINNAPNAAPTSGVGYNAVALIIDGSVWAGADFGNFDGTAFGAATIEGYSNVYIDGKGYNTVSTKPTDAGYMNIGSSVLGAGTSCYAGEMGRDLIFRDYGRPVDNPNNKEAIVEPYTTATRNLMSIQFFNYINIDNTHLHLIGQGRINSLVSTEKYAVYEVKETMRVINGSSLFIDFPVDQVKKLGSYVCANVYAASPTFEEVRYTDLPTSGYDNKFRVNNGSYLNIKYIGAYDPNPNPDPSTSWDYGELEGFFYMMTDDENNTCAYARPKQSTDAGNTIPDAYNNPDDGGFLSYNSRHNTYNIAGGTANPGVQMPYENHTLTTKNGELYFRIWRYGGIYSYREGIFNAVASTTAGYSTADVEIALPAQHGKGSYFRIKTENGFPLIEYGNDVMTVNAGVYNSVNGVPAADGWMHYDKSSTPGAFVEGLGVSDVNTFLTPLTDNPNVNFGLVAIPQGSLAGGTNNNWLICTAASDAGEALTTEQWKNNDNVNNPSILFRLTYNNALTNNATWDPIIIIIEQCDKDGNVTDEIKIALSVSIITTINQDFGTQAFAMMNNQGSQADTYIAKLVLPGFIPFVNTEGDLSEWTFVSATWNPATSATNEFDNAWQSGSGYVHNPAVNNEFSMQIVPSYNFDNTVGWNSYDHTAKDLMTLNASAANASARHLAFTDGRNPTAFDFILHFDGRANCTDTKKKMGELVVTLHFTNLAASTELDHGRDLIITVEVFRRGKGANYYIDGVNGDNFYAGDRPDAAKKTLSGVYNRTEYTPGDNIFIVNTVTADGASALDWNGEQFGQVIIYRYPGGHPLKKDDPDATLNDYYNDYSTTYNPDNVGFAGTLVNVKRGMNIHGIVLDGAYNIVHASTPDAVLVPDATKYQTPTSPMINIEKNGTLTLYANSKLQWNYTNSNGGAVYNAGKLSIRNGSDILNNKLLADTYNGGGVYLKNEATLIVSDSITINNNYRVVNSTDKNSNVYLEGVNSVIQVGTVNPGDGMGALVNHLTDGTGRKSARIGVSKAAWPDYSYNPIAYSDGDGATYLGNIIPANPDEAAVTDYPIFDDDLYYKLVTLNNTPGYEPSIDYLFWVGTWVTYVRTNPMAPDAFDPSNIDTPEKLAWAISIVNGENGQTAAPGTNFNITADIDMSARIWVPMGTTSKPYTGRFNGNGHVIKGIKSSLNEENMGMFGTINGNKCIIQNMILSVNFTGGNSVRMGSVAAKMNGGNINNVETAGVITGTSSTTAIGGIVGEKTGGLIHSSFAVNTMSATNDNTDMGGLVGINAANLVNSYARTTMTGNGNMGGLAGVNNGVIENCYSVVERQTFPAFAYENNQTIRYCYADVDNGFVDGGNDPTGHGRFEEVKYRKELGYMYNDNGMDMEDSNNSFVSDEITYYGDGEHRTRIERWNGLLSSLNQWVLQDGSHSSTYTPWFRPTDTLINGDLPVLGFPSDNCMGTTDADGKYLVYGSINNANGLDNLLYIFNEKMEDAASSLFLYGSAEDVTRVPESQVKVYINENAALIQAAGAGDFINATVGVTFDNSVKNNASDYFGTPLDYDWHFLSSPLQAAPMGITFDGTATLAYGEDADIDGMTGNYMPNGLLEQSTVTWDLYSFYEPQYHWINLKRSSNNHWHYDEPHQQITDYTNETTFLPGKGYMAAISQDSYLCSTGTLNNGSDDITVKLTMQSAQAEELGCNLLGNPYQAYLDMSKFFANATNSSNLGSSYWVYIAEGDNYIPGNCSASTNYALPSKTLHPHQAFFVKTSNDNVNAVFSYGMATADSVGYSYFRDGRVDYPLVNLFATNEAGKKDLTVIEVNRPVMDGTPKMRSMNNANFELYTRMNSEDYSILFTEEGTERVAVGFKAKENGTYTLSWDTQNGEFEYLKLIDNITGGEQNMLTSDHYSFEAKPTDLATRFYVEFRTKNGNTPANDGSFAYFNGNEWVVTGEGLLQLSDIAGHVLYTRQLSGETSWLHFDDFAAGVYVLQLNDKTQKIVIK